MYKHRRISLLALTSIVFDFEGWAEIQGDESSGVLATVNTVQGRGAVIVFSVLRKESNAEHEIGSARALTS